MVSKCNREKTLWLCISKLIEPSLNPILHRHALTLKSPYTHTYLFYNYSLIFTNKIVCKSRHFNSSFTRPQQNTSTKIAMMLADHLMNTHTSYLENTGIYSENIKNKYAQLESLNPNLSY